MWNNNRKDEPKSNGPVRPPEAASVPTQPVQPVRTVDTDRRGATIGKAVTVKGDIYSEEDLFIDGEVQGTLHVKDSRLTIGPNGKAQSNVKAREVVIQGKVQGNVEAQQKITIRKEGSLVGDIKTAGIIIEDDAYFKGSIDIVRKENEAAAATRG